MLCRHASVVFLAAACAGFRSHCAAACNFQSCDLSAARDQGDIPLSPNLPADRQDRLARTIDVYKEASANQSFNRHWRTDKATEAVRAARARKAAADARAASERAAASRREATAAATPARRTSQVHYAVAQVEDPSVRTIGFGREN